MEPMGDQWTNALLDGIFSNEDDADADQFMAHLLISSSSSLPNEFSSTTPCGFSSAFWPPAFDSSTSNSYPIDDQYQLYPSFDNTTNNIFTSSHSQDSYYNNNESYYSLSGTTYHQSSYSSSSFGLTNNISFCLGENRTKEDIIDSGDAELHLRPGIFSGGRNINIQAQAPQLAHADLTQLPKVSQASDNNDHNYLSMENSRKRSLIISTDHNQKKRNVKPKKNNNRQNSKMSSCCCSDGGDDMGNSSINATSQSQSQSQSEGASTSKGRSSRGSASDPQSLYARKRREKINERLRILQNLVPNGTKVDISTMLEEAVQYVKFLQLQIKVLSSDDHWMYAPIVYNGMDIGIDMSIPTPTPTATSS